MLNEKPELLAPAGDLEKLKFAIAYGADAVYLGGSKFGLRASAKNFTIEEMEQGVLYAHERGKKVYVTLNMIPHNEDLIGMSEYVKELERIGVDAVLVADPGVLEIVKESAPKLEIHLSTQANTTNYVAANFWYKQGIKRVVVAREQSLEEIKELRDKGNKELEIEAFVHGAMCISYSGRCLLSNYMTHRDANRGECAQSCRWRYYLVEEKRPGEYFPITEDEKGTYIYNSKDLCMLNHIPELIEAGIDSLKIEGRMKSPYYVATVIRAYRMVIDEYLKDPQNYKMDNKWLEEIKKASYRDFTTGFYFEKPDQNEQLYDTNSYIRGYDFVGLVLNYDEKNKIATVEQRNRIFVGDEIEIFGPNKEYFTQKIEKMWNDKEEEIDVAPRAQQKIKIKVDHPVEKMDILRKELNI
ncbi:putative protease YrrO [Gottschalkia acidurici 9a]|uniref:Protease YrrO n=1 Tax=Gottschalkia acidurici (strain ATCC 7906 / DSM 604 / BCRC 14475 / CIP 104303 / KCTC 5404 / NCIMB 10678 / 9a) TaxID=1128398 RepID=K0B141_GOTA9|nr:U32 family peptidase [Gottschalkia acidurici]AFS78356.1 putative protease YrrO [Gottschalkia acidurici 9a]